ncbi:MULTISPECIES: 4-hydroxy-tetrahydrodipicolinate reductase [Brevibacterium]|uniref:4-hydroxy-tetrahydrodipicolinate reductase n=1 Tax=Brevibacterium TaxID=1696 RepID=UPI0022819EB4|nr:MULTISPECIES: 4-hydroxy-tetrahydrodipicolinate reductase [Brevibacterium]WAL41238.1 4-hydroxy-tetrahydrodipicolinate reductase [Brevibacterium sp. BRM-1]
MADIRVAVIGAQGRMGSHAAAAIEAAEGLELTARLGSGDPLEGLLAARPDVAVELTVPKATEDNVRFLVEHGIPAVVGTTGWSAERVRSLEALIAEHEGARVLIAPNFSIGAVLAMQFAQLAAPYFESAEVVETHHPRKLDAPSGTAVATAERIARARAEAGLGAVPDATESDPDGARGAVIDGIHVHAVRQLGMNATEEIRFGSAHEALSIRTDSLSTEAFMPGIVLAVKRLSEHPGLTVGLEHFLDA